MTPNDPNVQLELAEAARNAGDTATADRGLREVPRPRSRERPHRARSPAPDQRAERRHGRLDSPPVRYSEVRAPRRRRLRCSGGTRPRGLRHRRLLDEGNQTAGKELFVRRCGGCHVLADAGTAGTIGPNLDDAFAQARADGMTTSTFINVTRDQILFPITETVDRCPRHAGTGQHAARSAATSRASGFCVEDQDQAVKDVAVVRRTRRRHRRRRRRSPPTASRSSPRPAEACHTLADAGTSGHGRPEPRRREAAEGARGRPRDERTRARCRRSRTRSTARRSKRSPTTSPKPRASSRGRGAGLAAYGSGSRPLLGLEIDDDVRDTGTSKRSRTACTTPRSSQCERPGGMRREHDLVRMERPHGVLDRDERVEVADRSPRLDPDGRETGERRVEPLLRLGARAVLVRRPRLETRVERGADDEELRLAREREVADHLHQLLAADGLVRDDEHASLVRGADVLDARAAAAPGRAGACRPRSQRRRAQERPRSRARDRSRTPPRSERRRRS